LVLVTLFLAGCGANQIGGGPPASSARVGLVTDAGRLADKSLNASAYKGLKRAERELGATVDVLESKQDLDFETNIQSFITRGYGMVVTIGSSMAAVTLKMARHAPKTKFAIVDFEYLPDPIMENNADPYTSYAKNIQSLVFREDQAGYLVGALAGAMTRSNVVGAVYGLAIPSLCKFRDGYEHGAKWANPNVRVLGIYRSKTVDDVDWGTARGREQISKGADLLFGAGGQAGKGALLAAKEATKPGNPIYAIAGYQDPYDSTPEVRSVLLTSAIQRVDIAVFSAIKNWAGGKFKAGPLLFDLSNDGVGVAVFHDLEANVPQTARDKLTGATKALKDQLVDTGYDPGRCKVQAARRSRRMA
jgi:basic membrane protein A